MNKSYEWSVATRIDPRRVKRPLKPKRSNPMIAAAPPPQQLLGPLPIPRDVHDELEELKKFPGERKPMWSYPSLVKWLKDYGVVYSGIYTMDTVEWLVDYDPEADDVCCEEFGF